MNLSDLKHLHWNTDLPPVDVTILVALNDGTVWKVKREHWLGSRKDDPGYCCITTKHPLSIKDVIGWRYP